MLPVHYSLLIAYCGGEIMEEMFSSIANLGFPIVISIYLLVRIEGKLNELTASITELSKTIAGSK